MAGLTIQPPLEQVDILLLDGGLSTQLEKYVPGVDDDPLWTARSLVTHPDKVEQCHLDFIQAGSRIILTDSYQISVQGFNKYLNIDTTATKDVVKKSVDLVKSAITKSGKPAKYILIGGSVGPYGACQHDGSEYNGDYIKNGSVTKEDLISWHRPRIEALLEAGVDFLALETQPTWQEVIAILDLVQDIDPIVPVWITFAVKDENYIASGDYIKDAIGHVMSHPLYRKGRIFAMGVNCSPINVITGALDAIRSVNRTLPLVVYPNSGEEWDGMARCWKGEVQEWGDLVGEWLKRGVLIFGGCCRVDSKQISELRVSLGKALLKQLK